MHCRPKRDNAIPLPCFPDGILERYRSHRTNHIADTNKLLIEYQWNINRILKMSRISSKWGAPFGGRTGAANRPRGGRGDCPDEPPCRVAGSGNSRDRYPARGRGGAKRTQRAREEQGANKRKTYNWEAPWGAGRERGGREGAGRADAMRLVALRPLCPLAGGPGGLPRRAPVQGSGERQ